MLTPSQIDEFHRNGFLNGGRILTDEELDAVEDGFRPHVGKRSRWLCQ